MVKLTCVVTVHGIGFQQPPVDDPDAHGGRRAGYADALHIALKSALGARLGDDPNRAAFGVSGPVYVQSSWDDIPEEGLKRFEGPLVGDGTSEVAHVALVYSGSEIDGPHLGSTLDTLARTVVGLSDYAHPLSAVHMLAADVAAMLHHGKAPDGASASSLTPRSDVPPAPEHPGGDRLRHLLDHVTHLPGRAEPTAPPQVTSVSLLQALEQDVAAYVCRNDLRERLRDFLQEALARLAARDDVEAIVINAHSQGTVLAFDTLGRYAPAKVRALVTAGSPLRKYVDLFSWGERVGSLANLVTEGWTWRNVYDRLDPVADPLEPAGSWRIGDPIPEPPGPTLFRMVQPDEPLSTGTIDCPVRDHVVDNVAHCGGSLPAHNYWDNTEEFIPILAEVISHATFTGPGT